MTKDELMQKLKELPPKARLELLLQHRNWLNGKSTPAHQARQEREENQGEPQRMRPA